MRVAITGASGLIGRALTTHLGECGHNVVPLVRRAAATGEIRWDPETGAIGSLAGVDAVVHLAAAGIGDKRWTDDYKRQIRESRTKGTRVISEAVATQSGGPRVLLSASAIGIYGASETAEFDETSPPGDGFLADVCREWEAATAPAEESGARVVHLRTGIVLSRDGGALKKQLPLFRAGLGGKFGNGSAWQSWISIDDEVAAIAALLESDVSGPVNLTAPNPVTQAQFVTALGNALNRPTFMRVPGFAPKLVLGSELVDNLLFSGQKVLPRVLLEHGYEFRHAELPAALSDLLGP